MKKFFLLVSLFFVFSVKVIALSTSDFEIILVRYKDFIKQEKVDTLEIANIISSFNVGDHVWNDLDYSNREGTGWKVLTHLQNVFKLSLAVESGVLSDNGNILRIVNLSLKHWLLKDFKNANWYQNDVKVSGLLLNILVLLEEKLDIDIRDGIVERLKVLSYESREGANLAWVADIKLHYGVIVGDANVVRNAIDALQKELEINVHGIGIKPDYSYHFHKNRLQMFSYGKSFVSVVSRIAWELAGTEYSFSETKVNLIGDFMLKGWQWMSRGSFTIPGTLDREASRIGSLKSSESSEILGYLIELDFGRAKEYKELLNVQKDVKQFKLVGVRSFYYSDLLVSHNGRAGSFFVKTLSERTLPTESLNFENLEGKFLNAGNTFFIKDGYEYTNLQGSWDWQLLPGFTYVRNSADIARKRFTGSVVEAENSISVMDFALLDEYGDTLYMTKKAWFTISNSFLLVLNSGSDERIVSYTALDQSRWREEVVTSSGLKFSSPGEYNMNGPFWIYHRGWVYFSPKPLKLRISLEERVSSWANINNRYSGREESVSKVFMPYVISHGEPIEYAVTSVSDEFEAKQIYHSLSWRTLRNDVDAQVVKLNNGVVMAAVYKSGIFVDVGDNRTVSVDQPTLLIIGNDYMKVSNLNTKVSNLKVIVDSKVYRILLSDVSDSKIQL
jgi:chondroitin AC lyase